MNLSDAPFAEKKFMTVNGQRMAYIDEGEGDAIVFSHGNPTSSYLWRNIMPACRGLGRLVACDLIGQGDSDKLPNPVLTDTATSNSAASFMRFGISLISVTT
jgi:haloalkane dehalogenase